jgi:ADP-heptose:LPS heptosyltransferase
MNSMLVIRPGAIGDALLAFPVLKALKRYYAAAHITLVSNAQVLPLALASGVTDQACDFQDLSWSELFSTTGISTPSIRELLEQTDLAICWLRDSEGLVERNLKMAGAKHRIIAPGRPPEGEHIHIVDYLARTIGLPVAGAQFIAPSLGGLLNPSSKDTTTTHECFAIHPGGGAAQKCWPTSRFASVITRLWQQHRSILLLVGPADTKRRDQLLQKLSCPPTPEMLRILTNAPLLEVARQLQHCRGYLGNDSGISHLAAMLGVPTVAIFGPTDPVVWRPVGPSVKVLRGHTLEDVTIDAVIEAIDF